MEEQRGGVVKRFEPLRGGRTQVCLSRDMLIPKLETIRSIPALIILTTIPHRDPPSDAFVQITAGRLNVSWFKNVCAGKQDKKHQKPQKSEQPQNSPACWRGSGWRIRRCGSDGGRRACVLMLVWSEDESGLCLRSVRAAGGGKRPRRGLRPSVQDHTC